MIKEQGSLKNLLKVTKRVFLWGESATLSTFVLKPDM